MEKAKFEHCVSVLCNNQTPRVGSLLVTVFGELAQGKDAQISGTLANRLAELMMIKPEAVRVALHRLRKEGWIISHKNGRTSDYRLSDLGRQQSADASPTIYNAQAPELPVWLALFEPGGSTDNKNDGAWLTSSILLSTQPNTDADVFITPITRSDQLPAWLRGRVCDEKTVRYVAQLTRNLGELRTLIAPETNLTPLQTAALRVLLVHAWRRVVLKVPNLPDHVFPSGWQGQDCRALVSEHLAQLSKQPLDDLERCAKDASAEIVGG